MELILISDATLVNLVEGMFPTAYDLKSWGKDCWLASNALLHCDIESRGSLPCLEPGLSLAVIWLDESSAS